MSYDDPPNERIFDSTKDPMYLQIHSKYVGKKRKEAGKRSGKPDASLQCWLTLWVLGHWRTWVCLTSHQQEFRRKGHETRPLIEKVVIDQCVACCGMGSSWTILFLWIGPWWISCCPFRWRWSSPIVLHAGKGAAALLSSLWLLPEFTVKSVREVWGYTTSLWPPTLMFILAPGRYPHCGTACRYE